MDVVKKKRDWGLVVAGVLLILCGICFISVPGLTLVTITIIAGAGFLVSGLADVISYFRSRKTADVSGWSLAYAILDVLVGLMFLVHPLVFAGVLPWVIGMFFVFFGVFEAVGSLKLKKMGMSMWGWALFSGIIGILCGVSFFVYPAGVIIFLALFVIMRGVSLAVYGVSTNKMV